MAITKSPNEQQVYSFLINTAGFNSAVASGIMSNIYHESSFNPTTLGDNGTSFGLIQWHKGRWTALTNFCKQNGLDDKSVNGQMQFFLHEVNTSYKKTANAFKSSTNDAAGAYNAAYWMCKDYERPADTENTSIKRANYAKTTVYPIYKSGSSQTPTNPDGPIDPIKPTSGEIKLSVINIVKSKSDNKRYTFYFIDGNGVRSSYYITEAQMGENLKSSLKELGLVGKDVYELPQALQNRIVVTFKHGFKGNIKIPIGAEVASAVTTKNMVRSYLANPSASTGTKVVAGNTVYIDSLSDDLSDFQFIKGTVTNYVDADTIDVTVTDCSKTLKRGDGTLLKVGDTDIRIRLLGLNTLEMKTSPDAEKKNKQWLIANGLYSEHNYPAMIEKTYQMAEEARQLVQDIIAGKPVTILIDTEANDGTGIGVYSRFLGVVYVKQGNTDDYINVNKSIINAKSNIVPGKGLAELDYRLSSDKTIGSIFYPPGWINKDIKVEKDSIEDENIWMGSREYSESLRDFMELHNLKLTRARRVVDNDSGSVETVDHVIVETDSIANIIFRYGTDSSVVTGEDMAYYNNMNYTQLKKLFDTDMFSLVGTTIRVPIRSTVVSTLNSQNSPTSYLDSLYTSNLNNIPADSEDETYQNDIMNDRYDDRDVLDGFPRDLYTIQEIEQIKDLGFTRIGDCTFVIPPISIRLDSTTQTTKHRALRSKSSVQTQSGYMDNVITMELFFTDERQVNGEKSKNPLTAFYGVQDNYYRNGLRPLIAQFKKAPFLPIENRLINESFGIYSIAMKDLQLSTVPGFPGYIKATLMMYEFDHTAYIHTEEYFEGCFNWKLFRWYYQQSMQKNNLIKGRTYLQAIDILDDSMRFSLLDEGELLDRQKAINDFFNKVSPDTYRDKHIKLGTPSGNLINDSMLVKLGAMQQLKFQDWLNVYDAKSYPDFYDSSGNFIGLNYLENARRREDSVDGPRYFHACIELMKMVYNVGTTRTKLDSTNLLWSIKKYDFESNPAIISFVPQGLESVVKYANLYFRMNAGKTEKEDSPIMVLFGHKDGELGFEKGEGNMITLKKLGSNFLGPKYSDSTFLGTMERTTGHKYIIPLSANENLLEQSQYRCPWPMSVDTPSLGNPFPEPSKPISKYYIYDPEKDFFQMGKIEMKGEAADEALDDYEVEFGEIKRKANLSENDMMRVPFEIEGEWWIESIGANLSNLLIPLQVNGLATRSHQFIGSDDTTVHMRIRTKDERTIYSFKRLAEESQRLMREYRIAITAGVLQVENNIFGLVGARDTIIEQVTFMNAQDDKESFIIEVAMTCFDRAQALDEKLDQDDIGGSFATMEDYYAYSKKRRKDENFEYATVDLRLRDLELYPDLELPTHDEVNKALPYLGIKNSKGQSYTKIPNPSGAKFVDPDFYVRVSDTVREQVFKTLLKEQPGLLLKDSNGFAGIDLGPKPKQELMEQPDIEFSDVTKEFLAENLADYYVADTAHPHEDGQEDNGGEYNSFLSGRLDREAACRLDKLKKPKPIDCEIAIQYPDSTEYREAYINNMYRAHNRKVRPTKTGTLYDTFAMKVDPAFDNMFNSILDGNKKLGDMAKDYAKMSKVPANESLPNHIEGRVAWLHRVFKAHMKNDEISRLRALRSPTHTEIHAEIKSLTQEYFGAHWQENSAATNYILDRRDFPHCDTYFHGPNTMSAPQITQEKIFNAILALFDFQTGWVHSVLFGGGLSPYLQPLGGLGISGINIESGIFYGQDDIVKAAFDWKYNLRKGISYFALCFSKAVSHSDMFISNNPLDGAIMMYERGRAERNLEVALANDHRTTAYYKGFWEVYVKSYGKKEYWDISTPGEKQNKDLIKGSSIINEIDEGRGVLPDLQRDKPGNIKYVIMGYQTYNPTNLDGNNVVPDYTQNHGYAGKPKSMAISDPMNQIGSNTDIYDLGKILDYEYGPKKNNRTPLEHLIYTYYGKRGENVDEKIFVLQSGALDYVLEVANSLSTPSAEIIAKSLAWDELIFGKPISYDDEEGMKNIAIDMMEDKLLASMEFDHAKIAESFRGAFHDILHYDQRGRLVRAFPTFQMFLIEEGRWMWYHKIWDRFYGYNSIISIDIVKDRRIAADTAIITLSNIYHNLNTKDNSVSYVDSSLNVKDLILGNREDKIKVWNTLWGLPNETDILASKEKINTLVLKPGARVHLRMGYGSNAFDLPIMMNGVISEMDTEEVITIVVQGDGIELTNKLQAEPNQTTNPGILSPITEPRKTMCSLLSSRGSFFANGMNKISGGVFYRTHPLGIVHFGNEIVPSSLLFNKFDAIEKDYGESGINVYSSSGINTFSQWIYTEGEKKGQNIGLEFGRLMLPGGKGDEPNVVLELYDKTPWDIFQSYAAVAPDYIAAVHPFEYRSTIFYGKPWWGMCEKYQYEYWLNDNGGLEREIRSFYRKPFSQYRIYTSHTDIISNKIKATSQYMYTNVIGAYTTNKGEKQTQVVQFDSDIKPQHQTTAIVHIPIKAKRWMSYFTQNRYALNSAVSALKYFAMDMYQGELLVMGDPSAKPHDTMYIMDSYTDMNGNAGIKRVVHHFSFETGFVSSITPDCITVIDDQQGLSMVNWQNSIGINVAAGVIGSVTGVLAWKAAMAGPTASLLRVYGANGAVLFYEKLLESKLEKVILGLADGDEVSILMNALRNNSVGDRVLVEYLKKGAISGEVSGSALFEMIKANVKTTHGLGMIKEGSYKSLVDAIVKVTKPLQELYKNPDAAFKVVDQFAKAGGMAAESAKFVNKGFFSSSVDFLYRKGVTVAQGGAKASAKGLRVIVNVVGNEKLLRAAAGFVWAAVTIVVTDTVFEAYGRFLECRQAIVIMPLQYRGRNFVAGIDGHAGSVVGDTPSKMDKFFEGSGFAGPLVTVINAIAGVEVDYSPNKWEDMPMNTGDEWSD